MRLERCVTGETLYVENRLNIMGVAVNNEVVAIGDSTLGALPATGVVKDTMAKFGPKWGKLFPKSFEPEGKTFVALNAVGYSVQNCYEAATKLASPTASVADACW